MDLLKVNESYIYGNVLSNTSITSDYDAYILNIIKSVITNNKVELNINFITNNNFNFNNNKKTLIININYEHTLVKQNAPNEKSTHIGVINYNINNKYLVRIHEYNKLLLSDIIIDYSIPNIYNIKTSNLFTSFSDKHIYIAPCIYDNIYTSFKNRKIISLTTFYNPDIPRRKHLLNKFINTSHININDCFDKTMLQDIYRNTKVLINIHQTDYHDTFEELRCLPALYNGVLVISEKSALYNLIPYNELIIWSEYENIYQKTKEVLDNYEQFHSHIFNSKNINILQDLHINNVKTIENIIR